MSGNLGPIGEMLAGLDAGQLRAALEIVAYYADDPTDRWAYEMDAASALWAALKEVLGAPWVPLTEGEATRTRVALAAFEAAQEDAARG